MLQKSSAFCCFCAEGLLILLSTRCLKQAEGVDYQRLPLGCFFVIFFLSAESCAED
jgi:hypothetical protein